MCVGPASSESEGLGRSEVLSFGWDFESLLRWKYFGSHDDDLVESSVASSAMIEVCW